MPSPCALEEAFLRANLPYRLVGAQRFYGRREVKDIIAYLRLIHNPRDQVSLLRVINTPPRGIGTKTIELLLKTAEESGQTPVEILLQIARNPGGTAFGSRAEKALFELADPLHRWLNAKEHMGLLDLMDTVLRDIGYRQFLDDGSEEGLERWENCRNYAGSPWTWPSWISRHFSNRLPWSLTRIH